MYFIEAMLSSYKEIPNRYYTRDLTKHENKIYFSSNKYLDILDNATDVLGSEHIAYKIPDKTGTMRSRKESVFTIYNYFKDKIKSTL